MTTTSAGRVRPLLACGALAALIALCTTLVAQDKSRNQQPDSHAAAAAERSVIDLWPGAAPGSETWTQQETEIRNPDGRRLVRNVVKPTLTAYLPEPAKATGAAVVVAPGGAFHFLSWDSEGTEVAAWLAERGVAAFVLKYRTIDTGDDAQFAKMMAAFGARLRRNPPSGDPGPDLEAAAAIASEDARQAIKVVRGRSAEWKIDPDRIGILGCSAGGMTTMGVVMQHDAESRPNFGAPIYGGGTKGAPVPADAPPLFILAANDDFMAAGSLRLHAEWRDAGRPVELHVYGKGGHGFGMQQHGLPTDRWIERFHDWLGAEGLLQPAK